MSFVSNPSVHSLVMGSIDAHNFSSVKTIPLKLDQTRKTDIVTDKLLSNPRILTYMMHWHAREQESNLVELIVY